MTKPWMVDFVRESNKIEGILETTEYQIQAFKDFLDLPYLEVTDVSRFVARNQLGAKLRDTKGLNVRVGSHIAPEGGPLIITHLVNLLGRINRDEIHPWEAHVEYETLHPYTDGNGRSGRVIWAWQMNKNKDLMLGLGFLHAFYYQTLEHSR